jgi:hypothetical protein
VTGSGKTGVVTLRSQVNVLVVDVKGDLPNLLPSFPSDAADTSLRGWTRRAASDPRSPTDLAAEFGAQRKQPLEAWSFHVRDYLLLIPQRRAPQLRRAACSISGSARIHDDQGSRLGIVPLT